MEVFLAFLRLGATAFGGPAAHVAVMEEEFVRRRQWVSRDELLDLLALAQLVPGPNSTELAIHLGFKRAGWRGLLAGGIGFILPAALLTALLAWIYVRFGTLPGMAGALAGAKAVAFVVVLRALWDFGHSALTTATRVGIAAAALIASLVGVNELLILALAVVAGFALTARSRPAAALIPAWFAPALPASPALSALFFTFLKFGAVLFGSGYVLLAFLHGDLVDRLHWLTDRQLLDAVAAGQLTPGPVFSTATFVGFVVAGAPGAAVATLGIFLPAFLFVAVSAPLAAALKRSPAFRSVLDAVVAASLGLMGAVVVLLAKSGLSTVPAIAIAAIAAVVVWRWRVNAAWVLVGGTILGWLIG